jgi:hypothetical protein
MTPKSFNGSPVAAKILFKKIVFHDRNGKTGCSRTTAGTFETLNPEPDNP